MFANAAGTSRRSAAEPYSTLFEHKFPMQRTARSASSPLRRSGSQAIEQSEANDDDEAAANASRPSADRKTNQEATKAIDARPANRSRESGENSGMLAQKRSRNRKKDEIGHDR
jgi:hypothetical protein